MFDGSLSFQSTQQLEPYPVKMTERLAHWARERPDQTFVAKRGADGAWREITYRDMLGRVRSIAQALLGNPRLIIVDEPTAGLDPEERVRFHNLLSAIGENIIVILSTHIVSDVSDLCGRMAIIHQGRVLVTGEPAALVNGLQGRVWKKSITASELEAHKAQYRVVLVRLFAGRTLIHALGEQAPGAGFEPVAPDLEDLYFATIRGFFNPPNSVGAN